MTEKPQETEGILKGGKREPVAEDDQFPPESETQDTAADGVETEDDPRSPRQS